MYSVVNEYVVDILSRIVERIESKMENAWGPESIDQAPSVGDADGGDLEADNPTDIDDSFTMYLATIGGHLMDEFGVSENKAIDLIYDCADDMMLHGVLPPAPTDEDEEEDVATWLAKAKSAGFEALVLSRVRGDGNE